MGCVGINPVMTCPSIHARARAHTHTHTHTHTHVLTHTFKTWEESAMNESLTMTCPNSFRIKSIHTCGGEIE